jgi:DNA-binding transcriptional LysR family regulator
MDLRQLSALVAIADHGSFSAAAKALFTVQSNVSGHISRLERELGVTLIDRTGKGLTTEGSMVLERARRIQREFEGIAGDIASLGTSVAGDARIGVIGTTARWLMPLVLAELGKSFPLVHAVLAEGTTSNLVPRLLAGALDAAIVHLPVDEPELRVVPLFAEDLVVIAPTDHPLAAHSEVTLRTLSTYPLLLPPHGTALRRVIDRAVRTAEVTLTAKAEIDGVRLLASLAQEGFGPTIVPATTVPSWIKGDFRRVSVPELPRRVVGWVQSRRPAGIAPVKATLEVLRAVLAEHGEQQPGVYLDGLIPLATR